ncbi:hypothetical protein RZE82_08570 [Mollicutes bacterium LVI A0039]|nr:hypothetical protein RZE82_08570 [Mollicutes bacterium LVI A0039]
MKKPVRNFYLITTLLLIAIIGLEQTIIAPYIRVLYIVFTFAESYFVLQNYDFDHGIPYVATFFKLANTLTVLVYPLGGLVVHLVIHIYIYSHIRGLVRRPKRLKYDYTINNVIPGPFLLKVFASFVQPTAFVAIIILANLRIRQKLGMVKRVDLFKYILMVDLVVLIILFTSLSKVAFLIYMITLILFEFIPIEHKI